VSELAAAACDKKGALSGLILQSKSTGHIIDLMARPSLKEDLIDAALVTFHRQGFHASGIQDVADAALAPKGSVYNHFTSKEEIASEALRRYWERGAGPLLGILADRARPPTERLSAFFTELDALTRRNGPQYGCLIGNFSAELAPQSDALRDVLNRVFTQWRDAVAACIADGQETQTIRGDLEPAALADFLLDAWEGAVLRNKVNTDGKSIKRFFQLALGALRA
jgi:TetR/AcrR family transcriptional regulator, transcriptional repressor for nem operon